MLTFNIHLINKLGLHARAASKLVQCCNAFSSHIQIRYHNKDVDAKSIMSVMLLAAPNESELSFTITGDDEQQAMQSIQDLILRRFDEAE